MCHDWTGVVALSPLINTRGQEKQMRGEREMTF